MFPIRPAVAAAERRLQDRREQIDGGSNEPTIRILQRPRHTFGPVLSRTLSTGRFPEPCPGRPSAGEAPAGRLWGGRRYFCVGRRGRALRPRPLAPRWIMGIPDEMVVATVWDRGGVRG